MFLATALGLAAMATEARAPVAFQRAELEAMSTKELAGALLLPDSAEVVVSHRLVNGILAEGNYQAVEFLTGPRAIADNFCARSRYYVVLRPAAGISEATLRTDAPAIATSVHLSHQIALAADCTAVPGYAELSSGDIVLGMELLSYLAELRDQARSSVKLPVTVSCTSELEDDSCRAGARARLASLKIEQAVIITRPSRLEGSRWRWRISIPEVPGAASLYAEVNLDSDPGCATEIEIRRRIPAPF
jgi:hypothetical protein